MGLKRRWVFVSLAATIALTLAAGLGVWTVSRRETAFLDGLHCVNLNEGYDETSDLVTYDCRFPSTIPESVGDVISDRLQSAGRTDVFIEWWRHGDGLLMPGRVSKDIPKGYFEIRVSVGATWSQRQYNRLKKFLHL